MRKRQLLRWRVIRIRGPRAEVVGVVAAANEAAAIKVAAKEYKINPEQQRRLAARLED